MRLDFSQEIARQRRQRRQPRARVPIVPKTKDGYLCLDPRVLPPFFRPQKTPCVAPQIAYGDSAIGGRPSGAANPPAPPNLNRLLDASNDGTYSQARRAAILGYQDELATGRAIAGLARAAQDGRVDEEAAANRIAELAAPPLGAAQAADFIGPLTAAQLAARRAADRRGTSGTTFNAAQAAKLEEACVPKICYIEKDTKGNPVAINYTTGFTATQIMARPSFLRFCTPDEIRFGAGIPDKWGEWIVRRGRELTSKLGLTPEPEPHIIVIPVPGAPTQNLAPTRPGGYLCLDPRILPPAFRPQPTPCVPPQIEYQG